MAVCNEGKNMNRIPNSNGMCLLDNWFEERANYHLDSSGDGKFKHGHKDILANPCAQKGLPNSITHTDYKALKSCEQSSIGIRTALLHKTMVEEISQAVDKEFNPEPEPTDHRSVTKVDFHHTEPPPPEPPVQKPMNFVREQPVTFWTEHVDRVTGITQKKTGDTPFRKNVAFSTPTEYGWNEVKPYELEKYPKM